MKNARFTAFAVSKLLRLDQQTSGVKSPPTQVRVKGYNYTGFLNYLFKNDDC